MLIQFPTFYLFTPYSNSLWKYFQSSLQVKKTLFFHVYIATNVSCIMRDHHYLAFTHTLYIILLIKVSISPIESMDIMRHLMYNNIINKIEDKKIPKVASNSIQNHLQLKLGLHIDV